MDTLLRRYRVSLGLFLVGLVLAGVTAFPLLHELRLMCRVLGIDDPASFAETDGLRGWVARVAVGLEETHARHPFIAYGTDWLAFGHLSVAVFFVRPLWRPLESDWVLRCGLVCCAAIIPVAFIAGHFRGIPVAWRLIDCSFGVFGALPLLYCLKMTRLMREELTRTSAPSAHPPDPALLLRVLSGERVFGCDVDSLILQASNGMSARLMMALFRRCDSAQPGWEEAFARGAMAESRGPDILMALDDGRSAGGDRGEMDFSDPVGHEAYLRLEFSNEEACYYQFSSFPPLDAPFVVGHSRKRAGASQFLRIELSDRASLQTWLESTRGNPHLKAIHESTFDEFAAAPSHSI